MSRSCHSSASVLPARIFPGTYVVKHKSQARDESSVASGDRDAVGRSARRRDTVRKYLGGKQRDDAGNYIDSLTRARLIRDQRARSELRMLGRRLDPGALGRIPPTSYRGCRHVLQVRDRIAESFGGYPPKPPGRDSPPPWTGFPTPLDGIPHPPGRDSPPPSTGFPQTDRRGCPQTDRTSLRAPPGSASHRPKNPSPMRTVRPLRLTRLAE